MNDIYEEARAFAQRIKEIIIPRPPHQHQRIYKLGIYIVNNTSQVVKGDWGESILNPLRLADRDSFDFDASSLELFRSVFFELYSVCSKLEYFVFL